MGLYPYPQIMYRSDGMTANCNSDSDIAALPQVVGQAWSPTPWVPANYNTGTAQNDYNALVASNEALSLQLQALQATLASENAILASSGQ